MAAAAAAAAGWGPGPRPFHARPIAPEEAQHIENHYLNEAQNGGIFGAFHGMGDDGAVPSPSPTPQLQHEELQSMSLGSVLGAADGSGATAAGALTQFFDIAWGSWMVAIVIVFLLVALWFVINNFLQFFTRTLSTRLHTRFDTPGYVFGMLFRLVINGIITILMIVLILHLLSVTTKEILVVLSFLGFGIGYAIHEVVRNAISCVRLFFSDIKPGDIVAFPDMNPKTGLLIINWDISHVHAVTVDRPVSHDEFQVIYDNYARGLYPSVSFPCTTFYSLYYMHIPSAALTEHNRTPISVYLAMYLNTPENQLPADVNARLRSLRQLATGAPGVDAPPVPSHPAQGAAMQPTAPASPEDVESAPLSQATNRRRPRTISPLDRKNAFDQRRDRATERGRPARHSGIMEALLAIGKARDPFEL